jgi:replicative DNA helicase
MSNLPTNIQAERQTIGAVLNDSDALQKIPHIKPEHFSDKIHQIAWEIMTKMVVADIVGLMVELKHLNVKIDIEGYKGKKYFEYCQSLALSGLRVEGYAGDVFKAWFGRYTINKFQSAILEAQKLAKPSYGIDTFIGKVNQSYTEIHMAQKPINNNGPKSAEEIIQNELLPRIDARRNKTMKTISTGLHNLDRAMHGGFEEGTGSVFLIGADSGIGKSEFAITLTRNIIRQGKRGLIFTMEMDNWQYIQRILQMEYNLPQNPFVNTHLLADNDFVKFRELVANTKPKLFIDDGNSVTPSYIFMTIQNLINTELKPDFVVIDYVSLQSVNEAVKNNVRSETQKILHLHSSNKATARHFKIPFIVLEQYNKQVMNQKPTLASIKGNAHNDADMVAGIYWPAKQNKKRYGNQGYPLNENEIEIHIPKNRIGQWLGVCSVERNTNSGLYENIIQPDRKTGGEL